MAADDKQKGNATGFSGLSTLVSDVEDSRPVSKPAPEVVPPPSAPPPSEPPPRRVEEVPTASTAAPQTKAKNDSSSDATTGKWMVGIGLGIGLLLIIFVNGTKHESSRPVAAPAAQAPVTVTPSYPPPPAAPDVPRQQPEAVIQRSAPTESVSVLGQQVVFSNPRGYCTPGNSAREVELMDLARRSLGEGSRLVHAAVRCSELEDYRKGRRDMLDHWLQIQLIGPKGNFQRFEVPRETFLSDISKSSPRVNAAELNRRLKASVESSDINLSDMKFEPFGRDGNAVYFSMRMNMDVGDLSRPVTGISGITLLNSLPLSINVYEGTGSPQSRGQLQTVQQELLNSLLTEN